MKGTFWSEPVVPRLRSRDSEETKDSEGWCLSQLLSFTLMFPGNRLIMRRKELFYFCQNEKGNKSNIDAEKIDTQNPSFIFFYYLKSVALWCRCQGILRCSMCFFLLALAFLWWSRPQFGPPLECHSFFLFFFFVRSPSLPADWPIPQAMDRVYFRTLRWTACLLSFSILSLCGRQQEGQYRDWLTRRCVDSAGDGGWSVGLTRILSDTCPLWEVFNCW